MNPWGHEAFGCNASCSHIVACSTDVTAICSCAAHVFPVNKANQQPVILQAVLVPPLLRRLMPSVSPGSLKNVRGCGSTENQSLCKTSCVAGIKKKVRTTPQIQRLLRWEAAQSFPNGATNSGTVLARTRDSINSGIAETLLRRTNASK